QIEPTKEPNEEIGISYNEQQRFFQSLADTLNIHQSTLTSDARLNFKNELKVQLGHTYAVVVNNRLHCGLFPFKLIEFVPDKRVDIEYSVKSYRTRDNLRKTFAGF